MRYYRYLAIADDKSVYAIKSKKSLDVNNTSDCDWLARQCDGKTVLLLVAFMSRSSNGREPVCKTG